MRLALALVIDEAAASDEACAAYIGVTQAFNADEPDPEAIGPLLDDLEANTPDDIEGGLQLMVDYEFEGAPEEVDAGQVAFLFENVGEELHEMVLLRKKYDTTESFDEILELPEEEGQALVDATFAAFGFPGHHVGQLARPRSGRVQHGLLHPGRQHSRRR